MKTTILADLGTMALFAYLILKGGGDPIECVLLGILAIANIIKWATTPKKKADE